MKFSRQRKTLIASVMTALLISGFSFASIGSASETVIVTPGNSQGWGSTDIRGEGTVNYVADSTSPYPAGALQFTTDSGNASKANYMHEADEALTSVSELGYWTKKNAGPETAAASFQLPVDLDGGDDTSGITYLVFEPYWNGTVVPTEWQHWDVDAGAFWSSKTFTSGTCSVVSGAGGPPFYTLAELQASCPAAVVLGFGVNVGTYNPNHDVEVDGVEYNGTVYDFELANEPHSANDCKDGAFLTLTRADGTGFDNQGDCIQYANTGK